MSIFSRFFFPLLSIRKSMTVYYTHINLNIRLLFTAALSAIDVIFRHTTRSPTVCTSRIFFARFLYFVTNKGCLISEFFFFWLKSKRKMPNHSAEHLLFRWIVLRRVICHPFF